MSTDRPPTDETTARSTSSPPVPPRSNVVFTRGRDDEFEFTPDGFIPRDRTFVKVYFDMATELVKLVGTGPFATLILSCRHAVERDGVLVIPRTAEQLAAELGIHRDTAVSHLGVLRKHGFVEHEQGKAKGGTWAKGFWIIKPASGLDRFGINVAPERENPTPVPVGRNGEIPTPAENACISPERKNPTPVGEPQLALLDFTGAGEPPLRTAEPGNARSDGESPSPEPEAADPGPLRLQQALEDVVVQPPSDNNSEKLQPLAALVADQLRAAGVYQSRIEQVLSDPGPEECMRQLIAYPYRKEVKLDEVRSKAAYLMRAIKERWDDPPEIKEQQAAAEAERLRAAEEQRDQEDEARRLAREHELDRALAALSETEQAELLSAIDAELLADGTPYKTLFERHPHLLETTRRERLRERLLARSEDAA